jgi:hypothetical protein
MSLSPKADRLALIRKNALLSVALSVAYLLLSHVIIGYRPEQAVLAGLFLLLFNSSRVTRNFITGFSIFIFYWVLFDYMKAFPNYRFHEVDIEGIYNLEKSLFGIRSENMIRTPNEFLFINRQQWLDIASGLFYLCWIPVPLSMAAYLFFKKRREFFYFSLTFLLVNFLGFIIYYAHPAAPPWYVQLYGFRFIPSVHGHTAGLARFDHLFHTDTFKSIYEKSSNVFAAMPSLHSSYPTIVLYYGIRNRLGKINLLFALITVGIWFAAVYTSHHYVLDVLAGITCAITGISLFIWLSKNSVHLNRFIAMMERATSKA